jgi:SSS family solute:Na+ symporter
MLLFDLLPTGILGLVLAGLIAAMMSSIDSALNSASTLITMDFYRRLKPHTTPQRLMGMGRVFTFLFMVAAAAWAPQLDKFPTLWVYLQSALSYIVPPIVALFFMGVFWKRANSHGALAGVVTGVITAVVFLIATPGIHFLYMAAIIFGMSCVAIVCVSLITPPPPDEKIAPYTWQKSIYNAESGELKQLAIVANYRYQAVALLAFTALILGFFW